MKITINPIFFGGVNEWIKKTKKISNEKISPFWYQNHMKKLSFSSVIYWNWIVLKFSRLFEKYLNQYSNFKGKSEVFSLFFLSFFVRNNRYGFCGFCIKRKEQHNVLKINVVEILSWKKIFFLKKFFHRELFTYCLWIRKVFEVFLGRFWFYSQNYLTKL